MKIYIEHFLYQQMIQERIEIFDTHHFYLTPAIIIAIWFPGLC